MTIHPNSEQRKKLKRYDIPGHAHETFSCYHRFHYLNDPIVAHYLLTNFRKQENIFDFDCGPMYSCPIMFIYLFTQKKLDLCRNYW